MYFQVQSKSRKIDRIELTTSKEEWSSLNDHCDINCISVLAREASLIGKCSETSKHVERDPKTSASESIVV